MARVIIGVVVGYIVSVAVVLIGILITWTVLGFEGSFAENSTVASTPWSISICVFGFIAAVCAGATAASIGRHPQQLEVKILAGVMLVLGLGIAVVSLGVEPQPVPAAWTDGEVTFMEAGEFASSPAWYNFAIAIIGAVGVLVGGNLAHRPA